MRLLLIFEFAFPPYREFLIRELRKVSSKLAIYAAQDKFVNPLDVKSLKRIIGSGESALYTLPIGAIANSDVVIVSANIRRPHTWLGMFLFPKKRWILWGQGIGRSQNNFVKWLRAKILQKSSGYVVYTEQGKVSLINEGYPSECIAVANNTLQVKNSVRTEVGNYLLYVGRIQSRKNIEGVFPWLRELNIRLRVVGDGAHLTTLRERASYFKVEDLIDFYVGTHSDDELLEHFRGALLYFSPGHVGLGVVHAFSYGVPVMTMPSPYHAPEFHYCTCANSYLLNQFEELNALIDEIRRNVHKHELKCDDAFNSYTLSLSSESMVRAFVEIIQRDSVMPQLRKKLI
ncbi:MAG: glycosyltransferase [Idiomarina sp.]|nr:glycosyltransferase [Idiomarina sp.]